MFWITSRSMKLQSWRSRIARIPRLLKQGAKVEKELTLLEKVQYCLEYNLLLSDWEADFMQDMENRLLKQGNLSSNQKAKINQIHEKVR